ncbi:hypothetical protein D3C78_1292850 [compost metagenome]
MVIDVIHRHAATPVARMIGRVVTVPGAPPRLAPGTAPDPTADEAKAPADRRVPGKAATVTVGSRAAVPDVANPGVARVSGAIHHYAIAGHCAVIARRITDVYLLVGAAVDANIGHVMQRRIGWNGVDHRRDVGGNHPRALRCGGGKPYAVFHCEEALTVYLDHRHIGVPGILQRRTVDRSEFGAAAIITDL